jgi:hypothetical protein
MDTNSYHDAASHDDQATKTYATAHDAKAPRATAFDAPYDRAHPAPIVAVEFGSGWYHAEALKDAENAISRRG